MFERLHADRFDESCDEKEEFELQVEDIIPYHNIKSGSSSDTKFDFDVNKLDVSSSGCDKPNICFASDIAIQERTTIGWRNILEARGAGRAFCCKLVFRTFRAYVVLLLKRDPLAFFIYL